MAMTRRILVKVGGESLQAEVSRRALAAELATVRALGHDLVVVHGAGPQITALAGRLGVPTVMKGGRRVTDAAMLEAVRLAMCGEVGPLLLAACVSKGLAAVPVPACAGSMVVGQKRPPCKVPGEPAPVDFGLVADVKTVETKLLAALIEAGFVPLVSSLVCDAQGQLLNLNADTLATALCRSLRFDDVVLVTSAPGVFRDLKDPSSHLPYLDASDIPALLAAGSVQGGMIAKLEEVAAIVAVGVERVWIVGHEQPEPIASVLRGEPGTRTVVAAVATATATR
jgi:acetylglutamate kinase